MKKTIVLSFAAVLCLNAEQVALETIEVETSGTTEIIKDVRGEELKSADLWEALFKQSASVSLVRRSGIANDIRVRGQKKDNISVTIDGAKIHGACPNRMDPPISHVLTNNVDYIEINEGPFNVEDFGVLSADIKIHTIKPEEEFSGSVDLGLGSFGYQKGAFSLTGGTDTLRFLLSGSMEKGEQYEDGNGDDFVGQIDRNIAEGNVPASAQYQDKYKATKIPVDTHAAGVVAIDAIWQDLKDSKGLEKDCKIGKSLGYSGKSIIHPDQISVVHKLFHPNKSEILWAEKVCKIYLKSTKKGKGATTVDGKMIDEVHFKQAKALLELVK